MEQSANLENFNLSEAELTDLKCDLLATVYNQTNTQLLIYQRAICYKSSKQIKQRKSTQNSTASGNEETMPSADILNDIKLDKELDALRSIYELAYSELKTTVKENVESHNNLKLAIAGQKQNTNDADILSKEILTNKTTLKQLKEQLKTEKIDMEQKLIEKTERIAHLRNQLANIKRISQLEVRLVEKWEQNRLSQATIVGEKGERLRMQEIIYYHRRLAGEQRLINEIESFRKNEISELKDKISEWEQKFIEEKSKINAKNSSLIESIADIIKLHEKHCETTQHRKEFVEEYMKQKAEEERLLEEQRFRVECAIRIQAWWRGVMVRRGFGPYRKKLKKSKKSKGKK